MCITCVLITERNELLDLHDWVERFLTTEDFGTKYEKAQLRLDSDERAINILANTTRRVGDRYETLLLWRD